jgi:hypothetical protein
LTSTKIRLNKFADDVADIAAYFQVRSMQLRPFGFEWTGVLEKHDCGYVTTFRAMAPNGLTYNSFYLPNSMRGRGLGKQLIAKCELPIITMPNCGVTAFIKACKQAPRVVQGAQKWPDYTLISRHYGSQRAERTGQFYMQHIDEGLFVLTLLGAEDKAKRAYCIHPLVQDDGMVDKWLPILAKEVDAHVLALAMEYRNLANAYLPKHFSLQSAKGINVGVIYAVKHMLIADKVQNYKDFLLHTPNVGAVDRYIGYFNSWFAALGFPFKSVDMVVQDLNNGDFVGNGKVQIVEKTSQTSQDAGV